MPKNNCSENGKTTFKLRQTPYMTLSSPCPSKNKLLMETTTRSSSALERVRLSPPHSIRHQSLRMTIQDQLKSSQLLMKMTSHLLPLILLMKKNLTCRSLPEMPRGEELANGTNQTVDARHHIDAP